MVDHAGGFRLEYGRLHQIKGEAFMLVSDLDDTMFGDDEASKLFKDFWERDARLRGSCLVYNTGRALDKWLSLWKEKSWCLAAPDHLITSVGTKVFRATPDVRLASLLLDLAYNPEFSTKFTQAASSESSEKAHVELASKSTRALPHTKIIPI